MSRGSTKHEDPKQRWFRLVLQVAYEGVPLTQNGKLFDLQVFIG